MSHVDDSHLDDHDGSDAPTRPVPAHDWSQLGLAAGLVVVAVVILVDAAGLRQDFAQIDPIGPRVFPQIVAVGLIVLAVLLTIATFRGSVPEGAEGEADGKEFTVTYPEPYADWEILISTALPAHIV